MIIPVLERSSQSSVFPSPSQSTGRGHWKQHMIPPRSVWQRWGTLLAAASRTDHGQPREAPKEAYVCWQKSTFAPSPRAYEGSWSLQPLSLLAAQGLWAYRGSGLYLQSRSDSPHPNSPTQAHHTHSYLHTHTYTCKWIHSCMGTCVSPLCRGLPTHAHVPINTHHPLWHVLAFKRECGLWQVRGNHRRFCLGS